MGYLEDIGRVYQAGGMEVRHWRMEGGIVVKRLCLVVCAALMAASCALAAEITSVKARQRYPWNGLVDIDVTVKDAAGALAASPGRYSFRVSACDEASGQTVLATDDALEMAAPTAGEQRLVWNLAKNAPALKTDRLVFQVELRRVSGALPLYWVVDLSGGPTAERYPMTALDAPPPGGWSDLFKTSRLVLRRIDPGTFIMGQTPEEVVRDVVSDSETPHRVTLTQFYYIGVFEITRSQWELVMGKTKDPYTGGMASYASSPLPKEGISYDDICGTTVGAAWPEQDGVDAESFLGKLRAKTGGARFDLPTEAQWEYACRAGTRTALNSGKPLTNPAVCANLEEVARCNGNCGYQVGNDKEGNKIGFAGYFFTGDSTLVSGFKGYRGTAPVGSYLPNAWGLYDMHGNVWEWCRDWYNGEKAESASAAVDPKGGVSGTWRSMRGGNWMYPARYCTSGSRVGQGSNGSSGFLLGDVDKVDIGFRVILRP